MQVLVVERDKIQSKAKDSYEPPISPNASCLASAAKPQPAAPLLQITDGSELQASAKPSLPPGASGLASAATPKAAAPPLQIADGRELQASAKPSLPPGANGLASQAKPPLSTTDKQPAGVVTPNAPKMGAAGG